jgi:UDP-N-acetylglucosamine/UDP-N-acetylgalactosamine diphosphorylase
MPAAKDKLVARLEPHGQAGVLRFWDRLSPAEQEALAAQIEALDLQTLGHLFRGTAPADDWAGLAARAEGPPSIRLQGPNPYSPADARARGAAALAQGKVAAIIVAGGQATRLGFDHPKGMYPIGPVTGATLFQILCQKVLAAGRRAGVAIPLLVMTSPATHEETLAYFDQVDHHGIATEDLAIFCQGMMPALDAKTGELLLEGPGQLALSPDGHGGLLAALAKSGRLAWLQERGVELLFYMQVDNPLVRACDAEFLGYHLLAQSQATTKVVAKRSPSDKLGCVVQADGRVRVIEYSDLPTRDAERRNPDGGLTLWAGSTAVHVFDVAFLARLAAGLGDEAAPTLPFHRAIKKVPCLNAAGELITPTEPNAVKFERFIFDTLPAAERALVVEAEAADEFAAVKNAAGAAIETPEWVQQHITAQARRWLEGAGATIEGNGPLEISPLWALDAGEAQEKAAGMRVRPPAALE